MPYLEEFSFYLFAGCRWLFVPAISCPARSLQLLLLTPLPFLQ
jgi:hypothetical protein